MGKFGEPWNVKGLEIVDCNDIHIAEGAYCAEVCVQHKDRIVKTINACAGMDDPEREIKRLSMLDSAIAEIRELASWHYDPDACEDDESPEDMVAHINGLIVARCNLVLGES